MAKECGGDICNGLAGPERTSVECRAGVAGLGGQGTGCRLRSGFSMQSTQVARTQAVSFLVLNIQAVSLLFLVMVNYSTSIYNVTTEPYCNEQSPYE